jgi:putative glutamine amidotransferase
MDVHAPLTTWAIADDGVIKGVRHADRRMLGLMWHPERREPFAEDDITLFSGFFEV